MHNKLRIAASLLSLSASLTQERIKRASRTRELQARNGRARAIRRCSSLARRGGAVEEGGRIGGRGDRNRFRNDLDDDPIAVVVHSATQRKRDRRSGMHAWPGSVCVALPVVILRTLQQQPIKKRASPRKPGQPHHEDYGERRSAVMDLRSDVH